MTQYIVSLLWGIVVLLSFFGWGAGFVRVVGDLENKPSKFLSEYFAYKATLGMALLVVLGGALNLLGVISPALCIAIVVSGAVWATKEILCYYKNSPKNTKESVEEKYQRLKLFAKTTLWLLVIFAALIHYFSDAWSVTYNLQDDAGAYMAFPYKMLQNGSLGLDPFSQRRLESSLGGQSFLNTFFLSVLGNESLKLLDGSLAVILMALMVYGICKRRKISTICIPFFILTIFCMEYRVFNITSVRTSYLITLCIFEIYLITDFAYEKLFKRSITFATLFAGACVLKGTNIAAMGLFLAGYYTISFLLNREKRDLVVKEATLVGVLLIAFMLPWMIVLYQSSGTFLYPILGLGYSGLNYYEDFKVVSSEQMSFKEISASIMHNFWSLYPFIIAGIILAAKSGNITRRNIPAIAAILMAVVGMNILFSWIRRYYESTTYPGMYVIFLWGLGSFFYAQKSGRITENSYKKALCILTVVLIWMTAHNILVLRKQVPLLTPHIINGVKGRSLDNVQSVARYQNLLNSVPNGAIILARLDKPYLLDFTAHEVWLNDWPGGASLPPGMPYKQKDGEALSAYLLSKNIRYIAYSYANQANYGEDFKYAINHPSQPFVWGRSNAMHTFDFQETVMNLSRKRRHLYDDSQIFILDLASPVVSEEKL